MFYIIKNKMESQIIESQNTCCICLNDIKQTNNCITSCGHYFCLICIIRYTSTGKNSCPCCRADLDSERQNNELNIISDNEDDPYYGDEDERNEYNYEDENETEGEVEYDISVNEYGAIELLTKKFEKMGYGLLDAMSLLTMVYSKTDEKYNEQFIEKMNENYYFICEETNNELKEQKLFCNEDFDALDILSV
jgi:hypothetical protein